ncbi:hypothetical protein ACEPAF_272 [Sanghuangporus sanghuang]
MDEGKREVERHKVLISAFKEQFPSIYYMPCQGFVNTRDDIGIPAPGLAFRILDYASYKVIYSRDRPEPQVGHIRVHDDYPDQWFTLVPGSGPHKGLYAIKSRFTGKALFLRNSEPRVGHIGGPGNYEDNWFRLEPGEGQYTKFFRLITPSEKMALVSRTHMEPELYGNTTYDIYPDQYFRFLVEDMRVSKVEYDFNRAHIISSMPRVLADQKMKNTSIETKEIIFSVNESVTNTAEFEHSLGSTIEVGTGFSEEKFTINVPTSSHFKWGDSTSHTVSHTDSFSVEAAPGETGRVVSIVNEGKLEVPFTIYLSSKATGVDVETKGTWRGVSTWDLRHAIETVKPDA